MAKRKGSTLMKSRWSDEELRTLEEPDTWDWEHGESQPGSKEAYVAVTVHFSRAEFEQVAKAAQEDGARTPDFIKDAALVRTRKRATTAARQVRAR